MAFDSYWSAPNSDGTDENVVYRFGSVGQVHVQNKRKLILLHLWLTILLGSFMFSSNIKCYCFLNFFHRLAHNMIIKCQV